VAHLPADGGRLVWRPLTRADLPELDALLTAIEHLDEPSEHHSPEALSEQLDELDSDPERDTLLGRDAGGTPVAYAWNHVLAADVDPRRAYLTGGVHPGWRQQGLGRAVFSWQLLRTREWYAQTWRPDHGPLQMICPVDVRLTRQRALYEAFGLQPLRWFADLSLTFDGPPPQVPDPPGIRIVPMSHQHVEAVRQAHNEAFADHWGSQPIDPARWAEQLGRSTTRMSWSWVALDAATSEVVGYVTNAAYEQDWAAQGFSDGWTDRLGVRRPWRGRGVARALLAASMRSYVAAGLEAAGIGVDTDASGGFALYESLGFRSVNTLVMYGRTEDHESVLRALAREPQDRDGAGQRDDSD
jgi:ribosomal protein S18 acetylase RimI-like enzyme